MKRIDFFRVAISPFPFRMNTNKKKNYTQPNSCTNQRLKDGDAVCYLSYDKRLRFGLVDDRYIDSRHQQVSICQGKKFKQT